MRRKKKGNALPVKMCFLLGFQNPVRQALSQGWQKMNLHSTTRPPDPYKFFKAKALRSMKYHTPMSFTTNFSFKPISFAS